MTITAHGVRFGVKRAAHQPWVDRAARLGLCARGVIYLMVGWLALQIAFGHSNNEADRQGALRAIANKPLGTLALVVLAAGFVGYAVWRVSEAVWGHTDDDGAKRTTQRLASAGRAALYLGFCASSLRTAFGHGGKGSTQQTQTATGTVLAHPFGRTLVIAAGITLIITGAVLAYRGVRTKFDKKLKTGQMGDRTEAAVKALGLVGQTARGVVAVLVGIFLIRAAATFDARQAKGLDGALKSLASTSWGKVALVLVAAGLVAFGAFSFAEARYRRTGKEGVRRLLPR